MKRILLEKKIPELWALLLWDFWEHFLWIHRDNRINMVTPSAAEATVSAINVFLWESIWFSSLPSWIADHTCKYIDSEDRLSKFAIIPLMKPQTKFRTKLKIKDRDTERGKKKNINLVTGKFLFFIFNALNALNLMTWVLEILKFEFWNDEPITLPRNQMYVTRHIKKHQWMW